MICTGNEGSAPGSPSQRRTECRAGIVCEPRDVGSFALISAVCSATLPCRFVLCRMSAKMTPPSRSIDLADLGSNEVSSGMHTAYIAISFAHRGNAPILSTRIIADNEHCEQCHSAPLTEPARERVLPLSSTIWKHLTGLTLFPSGHRHYMKQGRRDTSGWPNIRIFSK